MIVRYINVHLLLLLIIIGENMDKVKCNVFGPLDRRCVKKDDVKNKSVT